MMFRDFYGERFKIGDHVLTPSGRKAVVVGKQRGRPLLQYLDDEEEVVLDPRLVRLADDLESGPLVVPMAARTALLRKA